MKDLKDGFYKAIVYFTSCPSKFDKDTSCAAKGSLKKIAKKCNGDNFCKITASNSVFGDPCRGTYKYVEMVYVCRSKKGDYIFIIKLHTHFS